MNTIAIHTLPYERIDDGALMSAIRLFDGERLLVLQAFGWHIDGVHIPNAAEHFSREGVCADHQWEVVCDFGPYVAIVKPRERRDDAMKEQQESGAVSEVEQRAERFYPAHIQAQYSICPWCQNAVVSHTSGCPYGIVRDLLALVADLRQQQEQLQARLGTWNDCKAQSDAVDRANERAEAAEASLTALRGEQEQLQEFTKRVRDRHRPQGDRQRCLACGLDGNCCWEYHEAVAVIGQEAGQ